MYLSRHAAHALLDLKKHFSVVLITGPRQVGKTTPRRGLSSWGQGTGPYPFSICSPYGESSLV